MSPYREGLPSEYDIKKEFQEKFIPPKQVAVPAPDPALPPSFDGDNSGHRQGRTLVHFSAQPEPFLTQNTPWTPPHPVTPPTHPLSNP